MKNNEQCVILKKKEYEQLLSDSKNITGIITVQYCIDYDVYGDGIYLNNVGAPQRFFLGEKLLAQIKRIASYYSEVFKNQKNRILELADEEVTRMKKRANEAIDNKHKDLDNKIKDLELKRKELEELSSKLSKMSIWQFIKFRKTLTNS